MARHRFRLVENPSLVPFTGNQLPVHFGLKGLKTALREPE